MINTDTNTIKKIILIIIILTYLIKYKSTIYYIIYIYFNFIILKEIHKLIKINIKNYTENKFIIKCIDIFTKYIKLTDNDKLYFLILNFLYLPNYITYKTCLIMYLIYILIKNIYYKDLN